MAGKMRLGTVPEGVVVPITTEKRRLILVALAVFVATAGLAVILNSTLCGYGFHLEYSISRYVGLETWSAILFALGNLVVAGCLLSYLYYLAEIWQLPRWFNWLVVVMAVTLIMLSVCPVGYFDPAPGMKSMPTWAHEMSSRTMFLAMLLAAVTLMLCGRAQAGTRRRALIFATFGVVYICAYIAKMGWLRDLLLVFESLYLLWFMALCLTSRSKGQKSWLREEKV